MESINHYPLSFSWSEHHLMCVVLCVYLNITRVKNVTVLHRVSCRVKLNRRREETKTATQRRKKTKRWFHLTRRVPARPWKPPEAWNTGARSEAALCHTQTRLKREEEGNNPLVFLLLLLLLLLSLRQTQRDKRQRRNPKRRPPPRSAPPSFLWRRLRRGGEGGCRAHAHSWSLLQTRQKHLEKPAILAMLSFFGGLFAPVSDVWALDALRFHPANGSQMSLRPLAQICASGALRVYYEEPECHLGSAEFSLRENCFEGKKTQSTETAPEEAGGGAFHVNHILVFLNCLFLMSFFFPFFLFILARAHVCSSDLTQDDVLGADHQQVAFKLPADLLVDPVVHVGGVVRGQLVDQDLLGQLDGEAVPVDGDLLHQLAALYPDWIKKKKIKKKEGKWKGESGRFKRRYFADASCGMGLVAVTRLFIPKCNNITETHPSYFTWQRFFSCVFLSVCVYPCICILHLSLSVICCYWLAVGHQMKIHCTTTMTIKKTLHLFITFALKMRKVMFWSPRIYLFVCVRVCVLFA